MELVMDRTNTRDTERRTTLGERIGVAGSFLLRYGLVLVLVWIGGMKFTTFESQAIQPLVSSSPLLAWTYRLFSAQGLSNLLGCVELVIAALIVVRPWSARAAAVGSAMAAMMFLTTLSFLLSAPGWESSLGGFPALSDAGGFLLKDVVLFGAAIWSLGEALK